MIATRQIEILKSIGILEQDILVFNQEMYEKGEYPLINLDEFNALPYLEFHINDHCNLNCKGCSHFCPLVNEEKFTDYNQFEKDIQRLKELIQYIKIIRIMGGEPLLNKELDKFINITRKMYPFSDIRVVTNGILLPSLSDDIWNCMKENDVGFDISAYPAVYNNINSYVKIIQEHSVKLNGILHVSSFTPILHTKREVPFDNTRNCTCYNLHEGMISSCPMTFYGKYFNKYFEKNIPFESGNIDLYEVGLTGKKLIEKLNQPFELCKYCNQYMFGINDSENNTWDIYHKNDKKLEQDWY